MARILIIDDEPHICDVLSSRVKRMGHEALSAATLGQGLDLLAGEAVDLVFLDVNLPDGDGLAALPEIRQAPTAPEVVIITAVGSARGAELAIKNGAWDYIAKPFTKDDIILVTQQTLAFRRVKFEQQTPRVLETSAIVGKSPQHKACINKLAQSAGNTANVLIQGETGTGKELFARTIHDNCSLTPKNFVVVDCAAMPESLTESILFGHAKGAFTSADRQADGLVKNAHQGTLFLDEVGELPLPVQKSFLRVLQEKRFRPVGSAREIVSDFRLISATNRDLDEMVTRGEFREDLFHRLKTFAIQLPPLRERQEDIKPLAAHYMEKLCNKHGLSPKTLLPETQELLSSYHWPGNVRELVNAVEKAILTEPALPFLYPVFLPDRIRLHRAQKKLGTADTPSQNPLEPVAYAPFPGLEGNPETLPTLKACRDAAVEKLEIAYLGLLMQRTSHDLDRAAEISGLSKNRIYFLLRKYGISKTS